MGMSKPAMLENLRYVRDNVYVLFESGAKEKREKSGRAARGPTGGETGVARFFKYVTIHSR